jgi:hypothetical protein
MTLAPVPLAPAYDPGSWSTFFSLTGAAAATLTGLFFVAFSLRVRDLQLSLALRTRARYLLLWLIAIAIGSAFVVMPGQSRDAEATEILFVAVGGTAYTVWSLLRTKRWELPPYRVVGKDARGRDISSGQEQTGERPRAVDDRMPGGG